MLCNMKFFQLVSQITDFIAVWCTFFLESLKESISQKFVLNILFLMVVKKDGMDAVYPTHNQAEQEGKIVKFAVADMKIQACFKAMNGRAGNLFIFIKMKQFFK